MACVSYVSKPLEEHQIWTDQEFGTKDQQETMMKKIHNYYKVLCAALVAAMLSAAPVGAQELAPEHLELARKYIDLTDSSQLYEVTIVKVGIDTMRTLVSQNPEVLEQLEAAIGETIKQYRPRKSELMDQFARLYTLRFTMEELRQIVVFYDSEVGRKLSKENFVINQQLGTVLKIFEQNLRTEFFAKVRATLREQGIDL